MSNNRTQPGPSKLPFLAVEYEDAKAVISRNANYKETLVSIKKMFVPLRGAQDENIFVSAHLEEMDDMYRIADDIWSELLPRLSTVRVTLDCSIESTKSEEKPEGLNVQADKTVTIHLQRRLGCSWSGKLSHMYTTQISLNRTVGQLIEQVKQQENITAAKGFARINGDEVSVSAMATHPLHQCGAGPNSLIELTFTED